MKKTWLIASSEFFQNFQSRGYLVATFGLPLMALVLLVVFGTQKGIRKTELPILRMGLLDESGVFSSPEHFAKKNVTPSSPSSSAILSFLTTLPQQWFPVLHQVEAKEKLFKGELDGVYVIRKGEAGENPFIFNLFVHESKFHLISFMKVDRSWLFSRWLSEGLGAQRYQTFKDFGPPEVVWIDQAGIQHTTDYQQAVIEEREKSSWVHIGVFLVAIMLMSGYLTNGLTDEREQKTIEYLFTLVTPYQLLLGKLFGVILSGLLQVVTWGVTFIFPAFFFFWSLKHAFLNWLFPFLFFFCGYMFYGGVLLALASSASTGRQSRQSAASWLFLNAVPLAFYPHIISQPQDTLSRILSLVPLSSPITMMLRLGIDQTPWWELALSLGLLLFSTHLVLNLSANRVMKNMMRKV